MPHHKVYPGSKCLHPRSCVNTYRTSPTVRLPILDLVDVFGPSWFCGGKGSVSSSKGSNDSGPILHTTHKHKENKNAAVSTLICVHYGIQRTMPAYVYIITSGNMSYVGYTTSLKRRLRQHCGELVGGARYTKRACDWQYLAVFACDTWTNQHAMCIEYKAKHPTRTRRVPPQFRGVQGRLRSIPEIIKRLPPTEDVKVYVRDALIDQVKASVLPLSALWLELGQSTTTSSSQG